jgi:hypothetical protein
MLMEDLNLDPAALEQFAKYLEDDEATAALVGLIIMVHNSNNNSAA